MRKNFGPQTYICPQPVLIIGTFDELGNPNCMNAAWGGIYDTNEVYVCLADHKTTDNLKVNPYFTISIGDASHVKECDYVGLVSGRKVADKFKKAGFSFTKSSFVNAPIINELGLCLECEVKSFNDCYLVGKIVNVSVDETCLNETGKPDINKINPIIYNPINHDYMELGKVVGKAFSDGKKIK